MRLTLVPSDVIEDFLCEIAYNAPDDAISIALTCRYVYSVFEGLPKSIVAAMKYRDRRGELDIIKATTGEELTACFMGSICKR